LKYGEKFEKRGRETGDTVKTKKDPSSLNPHKHHKEWSTFHIWKLRLSDILRLQNETHSRAERGDTYPFSA
jgi:hypothetical protein